MLYKLSQAVKLSVQVTTITEWFWDFNVEIQLVAFVATGESDGEVITLQVCAPSMHPKLVDLSNL